MEALWARAAPVACLHPGAPLLSGRDEVMDSWAQILAADNRPKIACRAPKAFSQGETGFVVCYEQVEGGFLIATNIFTREDGQWRMVHHQAGPAPGAPPAEEEAGEGSALQ
jgi:hypothetical protein